MTNPLGENLPMGTEPSEVKTPVVKSILKMSATMEGRSVGSVPRPLERFEKIRKSESDNRQYRYLKLENEMRVLLIRDQNTERCAAAMAVQVGSMSDPLKMPGLAHFCEHLLLKGSEKYRQENEFRDFLSTNNGAANSSTSTTMTSFQFHVSADKLEPALDRFVSYFTSPLFDQQIVERELNAINTEFEKNLPSEAKLKSTIFRHLAREHPYGRFGSGNMLTLKYISKSDRANTREELLKFVDEWYSTNLMNLAVFGKESLDDLEKIVVEKFSQLRNKGTEVASWSPKPFPDSLLGSKIKVVPIKDIRTMTLTFLTKDLVEFYKSCPERYLARIIGNEGRGSILAELRKFGWCTKLHAYHENIYRSFGFFEIKVDLTQDGLKHVDDIIMIISQYLKFLKEQGPQKWIFDESVRLAEMRFRYKEKDSPLALVSNVVSVMSICPPEEILTCQVIKNDWNDKLIKELLETLTLDRCLITIMSQSFKKQAKDKEPYYGGYYRVEKIPAKLLNKWKKCCTNPNLSMPLPNLFLPSKLEILPIEDTGRKVPTIIYDGPLLRIWHKQEFENPKPKACMSFSFVQPKVARDPLNRFLNELFLELFKEDATELTYNAKQAGLLFDITSKWNGFTLTIQGYSEKQAYLLGLMLNKLLNFKVDGIQFINTLETLERVLKNLDAEMPLQHAVYYSSIILGENFWTNYEQLSFLDLVTLPRLTQFITNYFEHIHVEAFIFGNITVKKGLDIALVLLENLWTNEPTSMPLLDRQIFYNRELKLQEGVRYLFSKENDYHISSCAYMYWQISEQSDELNAMVSLLSLILREPCHETLKTKEQVGYIVQSGLKKSNGTIGFFIIVQSALKPAVVEERIEAFLVTIQQSLQDMDEKTFKNYKRSLIKRRLEKQKNFYEIFKQFNHEIMLGEYHFDRHESEAKYLVKITQEDFLNFFKNYIAFNGKERKLLCIHILSTALVKNKSKAGYEVKDHLKINNIEIFKSNHGLYPIARSHIDLKPKGYPSSA